MKKKAARKAVVWIRNNVLYPVTVPMIIRSSVSTYTLRSAVQYLKQAGRDTSDHYLGIFDIYPLMVMAEKGYDEDHLVKAMHDLNLDKSSLPSLAIYCSMERSQHIALHLCVTFLSHISVQASDMLDLMEDWTIHRYGAIDILIAAMHLTEKEHLWPVRFVGNDLSRLINLHQKHLFCYTDSFLYLPDHVIKERSCFSSNPYKRLAVFIQSDECARNLSAARKIRCSDSDAGSLGAISGLAMMVPKAIPLSKDEILTALESPIVALSLRPMLFFRELNLYSKNSRPDKDDLNDLIVRFSSEIDSLIIEDGSLVIFSALVDFLELSTHRLPAELNVKSLIHICGKLLDMRYSLDELVTEIHGNTCREMEHISLGITRTGIGALISMTVSLADCDDKTELADIASRYPRDIQLEFMKAGISASLLKGLNNKDRREGLLMDLGL